MEKERKDGAIQKASTDDRLNATKEKVHIAMQAGEAELETHFVENPFIKLRQKNTRRQLENANHLGVDDIKNQEDQDIILLKDHGKYLIKDLEQIAQDKVKEKLRKRNHQESFGYGDGLYISSDDDEEEGGARR